MSLLSPEGILMLFLAGLLDLIGIVCLILDLVFGIGEVLSFIPDGIGILFFGFWSLTRSQGEKTYKEAREEVAGKKAEHRKMVEKKAKALKKGVKKGSKKGLRFGLSAFGELIPFLGALPFWTIFVILEMKE